MYKEWAPGFLYLFFNCLPIEKMTDASPFLLLMYTYIFVSVDSEILKNILVYVVFFSQERKPRE